MPDNSEPTPETALKEFAVIEDLLLVPSTSTGLPVRRLWTGACIPNAFSDVVGSIDAPFPEVNVAPNTNGYTWSPILVGAKFSLELTVAKHGLPFQILLTGASASVSITVKPIEGVFEGSAVVPAEATRSGDFRDTGTVAIDFLNQGQPMPDNTVPANRIPTEYADAMTRLPLPSQPQQGANVTVSFKGDIPENRRLKLNESTVPPALSAAWEDVASLSGKSFTTTFRLLVGGAEVTAKDVSIPVHGLPDLVVVKPGSDPGPVGFCHLVEEEGPDKGKLEVTIKNQGTAPAAATTTRVDFEEHGQVEIPTRGLAPGEAIALRVRLPTIEGEQLPFHITADANNVLIESNTQNNKEDGLCFVPV